MDIKPAFRYHGSKWRLAPWVMQFFPDHKVYVEPFGGSAAVMLQKTRSYSEVYNDLDVEVNNFFHVVSCPDLRAQLIERLQLTPYSRMVFEQAFEPVDEVLVVERAVRLCIRAQMGFGSAGATKGATGFRCDVWRKYGTSMHNWLDYPARMAAVGERMSGVMLKNRPAIDVISKYDSPETFFFIDPPYMHETRISGNRTYRHEMTTDDHVELLEVLLQVEGLVVLCGYPNEVYNDMLPEWETCTTGSRISAARGCGIRTECVWINPAAQLAQRQRQLFNGVNSVALVGQQTKRREHEHSARN